LLILATAQAKVQHPTAGSTLRKAIMNEVQPYAQDVDAKPLKLSVAYIAVKGSAALVECSGPEQAEKKPGPFDTMGELTACFLEKVDGEWKVIGFITDPHEGYSVGNGMVVDLRSLKSKGFSEDMFQPQRDDMLKNLSVLDYVRKLGFLYCWACPADDARQIFYKVTEEEVDNASKLADNRIVVRDVKCDWVSPKLPN
ncbi:MAG: hypothetical protein ABUL72_05320, partial [Armatimonadota bacterium]